MAQEVEQAQATPVKDAAKSDQQPVEGAKWYKKWWIWVIVVIVLGIAGYFIFK